MRGIRVTAQTPEKLVALAREEDDEHEYAIVSSDGGFDAAIKMGERLELAPVRRTCC